MNIRCVSIKNFRNFHDFQIDFSEGFQTIIGENNIGKSNLYWAVRLILDKDLSYNSRLLDIKDFHGYKKELSATDHIVISIELYSKELSSFPSCHALNTSETTARITYLFAHKSCFTGNEEVLDTIDISQFKWKLFGGGNSLELSDILKLNSIRLSDLDGINLYYINAFRNINADLHGSTKSLLSRYCQSRIDTKTELESIKGILNQSSKDLDKLEFINNIAEHIQQKGNDIAGQYFSFPISLSFLSNYDVDAWSQLNLYHSPSASSHVPIQSLGLGQKNILYLSLFIAELENSSSKHEINILLIEEPEAHLHPQLQKILFAKLNDLKTTQVLMTSHSTHIASDCNYKNLNVMFRSPASGVKSFAPFKEGLLTLRENLLLKRYLDATRSEMFFASAIIFVEGVAEQFIIPSIAKQVYNLDLTEHNISVIPIHSRYFDPYLKLVQDNSLEIPAVVIIDGDPDEIPEEGEETTSIANARALEIADRVLITPGTKTLELDLFPRPGTNFYYLRQSFINLGHRTSYNNLINKIKDENELWDDELISRIDQTIKKGRFAQELSILIDEHFIVPNYTKTAIEHIAKCKNISL